MRLRHACLVLLLAGVSGCSLFDTTCAEDDRDCLGAGLFAKGVGGECERNGDCVNGLSCVEAVCSLKGDTPMGEECRLTGECSGDNYCGVMPGCAPSTEDSCHRCLPADDVAAGGSCTLPSDCRKGLACEPPDLATLDLTTLNAVAEASGVCVEAGDAEAGEACKSNGDCFAGLTCVPSDEGDLICQSIPIELPALPALWDGIECPKVDADAPPQAYFEVPRAGTSADEFYALPFPNDIRRSGGHIDLREHPRAPDDFGLPFMGHYMDLSSEDLEGFSPNPVVYFRFSHPFSFNSVTGNSVRIVDITPGSPTYDKDASIEWRNTEGRLSNYICPHFLAMRRPIGSPLRPGTTYAAVITTGIVPKDGGSFARGADFSAMLNGGTPSDSVLAKAHPAYQPLRDWIADTNQNAGAILSAAVFTTQDPEEMIRKLRAKVDERPAPTVSNLTLCESAGTQSPCEDETGRGACKAASGAFAEIHGKIKLPIFQQGTPPYLKPDDGGAIQVDGKGNPVVADEMDVCFAVSVPKAAAPAGGYAVLVYAHGTGGSFNGQMDAGGYAQELATAPTPAVLVSFDLPEHGARRGDSKEEPDNLFFNFLNPRAGRDNALQGAADLMSVVKWAQAGGLSAGQSPTGNAVVLDPNHIVLFGHSQGATHAALMASNEPGASATVLSGVGGHLATSLMTKTSPVDITVAVPFALLDPDDSFELAVDSYNPGLAIVQGYFERVDPINYAYRLHSEPTAVQPTGMDVFITYGIGDTFAPNATTDAYVKAGRITQVEPVIDPVAGLLAAPQPLLNNELVGSEGTPRTVGMKQYLSIGDVDGHFVATDKGQDGRVDALRFVKQALAGEAPQIGQ